MARYALNLPTQLKQEAANLAKYQGVSLNQFILWAVADKVGTLRRYLPADDPRFPQITYRSGASATPTPALRGTGIRVQTIVTAVQEWGMSAEEVATDYNRPLAQIKEALAYYEVHRDEVDTLISTETQLAVEAGYGNE